MANNELSILLDTLITMIVVTILISVVIGTAYLGINVKNNTQDKVDNMLTVTSSSYEDIETLLLHGKEVPMASIFKVVQAAEGHINIVRAELVNRATVDYINFTPYSYHPEFTMTQADYFNKFNMKFQVGGTKRVDGTYDLILIEVL